MTTTYINEADLELAYRLLMPQNRLICALAERTGLRIGDVLSLRTDQLRPRVTVRESKTGKRRRIYIPAGLLAEIRAQAGPDWAFPGAPGSKSGHKTRQAVWADIKRAQRAIRAPGVWAPHSLRKSYAVDLYRRTGDLAAVSRALNHDDPAVTALYALADHLSAQRVPPRRRGTRAKGHTG